VISSIACFHFAPTEQAADALLRENISKDNVFITGNTVIDALLTTKKRADKFGWLHDAIDGKFMAHNTHKRSILVTTHRRENLESGIKGILSAIKHLSRRDDTAIIFPVHPNPKIKDQANAELSNNSNVLLLPPLDYLPFVRILSQCHFVLTDSGGIQEEAPAFGKPVLIMRNTTERPEGISAGTALLVGTCAQRITMEATRLLEDEAHYNRMSRAHNPFGDGQASLKIRDILKRTQISHTSSKLGALQYAS
jgi:UDP-N-acetylglucosamine 2-epimerase (non-hydrolysing)